MTGGCCDSDGGLLRAGLGDVALALAAAGFAALWNGDAKRPEDLVPGRPDDARVTAAGLANRGRAELDETGELVGIHGLTLRPTRHQILRGDRPHHTWCAFDAVGIPAALELDASAHTDCPTCHTPLAVDIRDGAPASTGAVLWLPSAAGTNLLADFCANADLYCSPEHLERRIDTARTPGSLIDVSEAAALGRDTWMDVRDIARR